MQRNTDKSDTLNKLSIFNVSVLMDSLTTMRKKNSSGKSYRITLKMEAAYLYSDIAESSHNEVKVIKRYEVEWNKKLTMSFACLVFFFIGAPLGAIIRKGGLGTPAVISIFFFVIYYVISLSGQKLVEENIVGTFAGMWAASYICCQLVFFLPTRLPPIQ